MAIAFDGSANSGAGHNSVSSITYSHTVTSNSNGIIVVAVIIDSSANRSVSGITYNGVALTKVRSDDNATGTQRSEIWYLKAPATVAHNVVVSFPGNVDGAIAGSVSLTGVDQTNPVDAQAGTTPAAANVSVSITTIADNAWIVDCMGHNNSTTATMTAHTNRTQRFNVSDATNGASGAMSTLGPATPAGAFTMDWTASVGTNNAISAVSFTPAGAGGSISGAIGGTGSESGTLTGAGALQTAVSTTASFSGTLSGSGPLQSSIGTAAASFSGTLAGSGGMSSSITGISSFLASPNSPSISSSIASGATFAGSLTDAGGNRYALGPLGPLNSECYVAGQRYGNGAHRN